MKKPTSRLSAKPSKHSLSIGFVFDDSLDSTDGVAQYVKTLGSWFSSRGHKVSYLVGETKINSWHGGKVYSLSKNASVSFNANRLTSPLPASSKAVEAVIAKEKFDVLHIQVPYSPFMAQKVINKSDPGTAVLGTFHILPAGRTAKWGTRMLKPIYGRSLSRFDSFISVSQPAADFAQQSLGIRSTVLPNVVDITRFKPTGQKVSRSMKIVFLGRLVKRKGVMELLKAFELLLAQKPQARLQIAGTGPLELRLKRYVNSHKLDTRVSFTGYASEAEKPSLLGSADVACFPATGGETFGIVLIEAMAAGSGPVLGGDNLGYRSVLGPQPKLLINPADSARFAKRLAKLLGNRTLNDNLRAWQDKQVRQYDVAVVGPKIEQSYRQAIANRVKKSDN